jgi:tRNA/rRNA methyltransferase
MSHKWESVFNRSLAEINPSRSIQSSFIRLMNHIYIILVEPIYQGNVGAVARIMNNFELTHLRIVGSIPSKNDFYLAVHSEELLDNAEIFPDLKSAIKDLDRTIAVSRRKGKLKPVDLTPEITGMYVTENPGLNIGLIFGRETWGLTDEEASLCQMRCYIPANPKFPSLNLAQAVAILTYEIYKNTHQKPVIEEVADRKQYQDTKSYMMDVLDSIGFFQENEPYDWNHIIDHMLARLNPTREMAHRLKQMFNRIHVAFKGKGKGYH